MIDRPPAEAIRTLPAGAVLAFGRFVVKRVSAASFVLRDSRNPERVRWGDLEEINADVEHAATYDVLPPAGMPWW